MYLSFVGNILGCVRIATLDRVTVTLLSSFQIAASVQLLLHDVEIMAALPSMCTKEEQHSVICVVFCSLKVSKGLKSIEDSEHNT